MHGAWRAGGAGAGIGAAGFRKKELVGFLERLMRKEMALQDAEVSSSTYRK